MTRERWKPIEGFPRYLVSSQGRIKSPRRRIMALSTVSGGLAVTLTKDKCQHTLRVARAVGQAFQPTYRADLYPTYRNGDRADCRASNLKWVEAKVVTGIPYSRNPKGKVAA